MFLNEAAVDIDMLDFTMPLMALGQKIPKLTSHIGVKAIANPDEIGAASVDYLRILGHLVYGYFWARMAKVALQQIKTAQQNNTETDTFYVAKLHTARFYFQKLMPEVDSCIARIKAGGSSVMAMPDSLF